MRWRRWGLGISQSSSPYFTAIKLIDLWGVLTFGGLRVKPRLWKMGGLAVWRQQVASYFAEDLGDRIFCLSAFPLRVLGADTPARYSLYSPFLPLCNPAPGNCWQVAWTNRIAPPVPSTVARLYKLLHSRPSPVLHFTVIVVIISAVNSACLS